jgi:THUMP domain-like
VDGHLADPRIAYVYADAPSPTPYARCFAVLECLPLSVKRLRAMLRERGVGRLTIKKRGSALEPERLRRELRLSGPAEATVILTRVADAPTALLAAPV